MPQHLTLIQMKLIQVTLILELYQVTVLYKSGLQVARSPKIEVCDGSFPSDQQVSTVPPRLLHWSGVAPWGASQGNCTKQAEGKLMCIPLQPNAACHPYPASGPVHCRRKRRLVIYLK